MAFDLPLAPIEEQLALALPSPALELLRRFALTACSASAAPADQARCVVKRALGTELHTVFEGVLDFPPGYADAPAPSPRRVIEIAPLVENVRRFFEAGLRELGNAGVTAEFRELLRTHLESPNPRAYVSAVCALVVMAAALTMENA